MNWNEATEYLAAKVARKHSIPVSEPLREAVRMGIEWECDRQCTPFDYQKELKNILNKWSKLHD